MSDYENLKRKHLFLKKTIMVCEDCFLFYQDIGEKKHFPLQSPSAFARNTSRIAKKVNEKFEKIDKNEKVNEKLQTKETSMKSEKIYGNIKKNEIFDKIEKFQKNYRESKKNSFNSPRTDKTRNTFQLNFDNLDLKKEENLNHNSERTTGRITNRSKELLDKYSTKLKANDYFLNESTHYLRDIIGIKRIYTSFSFKN